MHFLRSPVQRRGGKAKSVLSCSSVHLVLQHWCDAGKEPFPIPLGVCLALAYV